MSNPFPCNCYILEDDPKKKAILVRPEYSSHDAYEYNNFTFWVPRKALRGRETLGFSENNWKVQRIYVSKHPWACKIIEDQYWEQLEMQEMTEEERREHKIQKRREWKEKNREKNRKRRQTQL